jgi:hypothetical protein
VNASLKIRLSGVRNAMTVSDTFGGPSVGRFGVLQNVKPDHQRLTSEENQMPNRRSNLQKMAREKSRSAFDRARKAIQLLQERRRLIDFKTVAQGR